MKTMCPLGYHHNGFVATFAYIYIYIYIYMLFKEKTNNILIKNISAAAFINSCEDLQFIYNA